MCRSGNNCRQRQTYGCDIKTQPEHFSHCEHKEGGQDNGASVGLGEESYTPECFRQYYNLKNYFGYAKYYIVQSTQYCIYSSWIFVSFMYCLMPGTEHLFSLTGEFTHSFPNFLVILIIKGHSLSARSPEENII